MAEPQPRKTTRNQRGVLARPLDALVFLLPLILFYELVAASRAERVIAFDWMRHFLALFGRASLWAPGLAVVIILLTTHAVSGERWCVHWKEVGFMYFEAALLATPLLLLNWLIPLAALAGDARSLLEQLALTVGAGIYEELVFRLVLISAVIIVGVDLLKLRQPAVAFAAICLSALTFSAHHHPPIGAEPFRAMAFLFRTLAGAYLATIFWYRGYGPAAGCHAAYNAALLGLQAIAR